MECDTGDAGLCLDERFSVNFGREPAGHALSHGKRFPHADSNLGNWVWQGDRCAPDSWQEKGEDPV